MHKWHYRCHGKLVENHFATDMGSQMNENIGIHPLHSAADNDLLLGFTHKFIKLKSEKLNQAL